MAGLFGLGKLCCMGLPADSSGGGFVQYADGECGENVQKLSHCHGNRVVVDCF